MRKKTGKKSRSSSARSLIASARRARNRAVATYSKFKVGAAVETVNGKVFTGCNIENASYGLTLCAERVALFKAISEGERRFRRVAVVTGARELTPPCGPCRQILWEFCGDIEVVMADLKGKSRTVRLSEIFPEPFDDSFL